MENIDIGSKSGKKSILCKKIENIVFWIINVEKIDLCRNSLLMTFLYLHYQDHFLNKVITHLYCQDLCLPNTLRGQNLQCEVWVKNVIKHRFWVKNGEHNDFWSKKWKLSSLSQNRENIDFVLKL